MNITGVEADSEYIPEKYEETKIFKVKE